MKNHLLALTLLMSIPVLSQAAPSAEQACKEKATLTLKTSMQVSEDPSSVNEADFLKLVKSAATACSSHYKLKNDKNAVALLQGGSETCKARNLQNGVLAEAMCTAKVIEIIADLDNLIIR